MYGYSLMYFRIGVEMFDVYLVLLFVYNYIRYFIVFYF